MSKPRQIIAPVDIEHGGFFHQRIGRGANSHQEARDINDEIAYRDPAAFAKGWGTVTYVMEPVHDFTARLHFEGVSKYRTSFYARLHDENGARYSMCATDLADFLMDGTMTDGWTEAIRWTPVKRGSVYGIRRWRP